MKKYQYTMLQVKVTGMASRNIDTNETENQMNTLGKEGWELVRTENLMQNDWTDTVILFFKKELP